MKKINPDDFDFQEVWKTWGEMVDLQFNTDIPVTERFFMYLLGGMERSKSPLLQMVYLQPSSLNVHSYASFRSPCAP